METILIERNDGVVTVTLNRPEKRNAANNQMWRELLEVFRDVAANAEDRVLVITGAGGEFCSGADLTSLSEVAESGLARMRRIHATASALHHLAKPTIAKVGGVAAGAGANLAFGCDLVVASDDARFSEIFARRGLSLDFGGSWLLPRLVGLHRAKELALLAEVISAEEARAVGVVNKVVPAAELDAAVDDWARRLAAGPPVALSMTKTLLNNSLSVSMDEALEDEARCQAVNFGTDDMAEAMRAFVEKRDPVFRGT
jgi:2-(1,2-epoxy-1,2-dihydrophenyl)acetyl-CoA isomerase